ncbi:hypothetical protein [Streptomyces sp. NBC_00582]|uniref:hypothetical protein n=1 Tax=Streptomyces sp. NBC_00582 TaxID=2975783 RepID=UPI00106260B4|nr:hypothetical protein [Streptomyces sp. NBC_00582]WUB60005.1 hypothetical protein OG852_06195 [Streptomyces sp. NBC_00582]
MGRVGRKFAGVQVTSRLTWTFSVRARLGRARGARPALEGPASAAGRHLSAALLRAALRAARRPRPLPPVPRPPRIRRGRRR